MRAVLAAMLMGLAVATPAAGQSSVADSIGLGDLHTRALQSDPRAARLELLAAQSTLRLRNLEADRLPAIAVEGQAQYQSDVAKLPIALPGGGAPPTPPNDTYDARVAATQRLLDPTLDARRHIEGARRAHDEAELRVALHALRQQVNDAFFAALRAQAHVRELAAGIAALETQVAVAAARVREGVALPSEEYAVRAELLRLRQALAEWRANWGTALTVLSELVQVPVTDSLVLALPDLADEAARARASLSDQRMRPEFDRFARARDLLKRQEESRAAQDRPRVSAYGRAGYGRPGLNPLNDRFDSYWLAGVQLQWAPWSWGSSDRDQEVLALQRQQIEQDEAAFAEQLRRGVAQDLATIDRLEAALPLDDEIIVLRERIAEETRARYAESTVTSAEYLERQTELLAARIARALHHVELAHARARFLTTLGIPVR